MLTSEFELPDRPPKYSANVPIRPGATTLSEAIPISRTTYAGLRRCVGQVGMIHSSAMARPTMPDRDSDIGMAKNSRATGAHLRKRPMRAGSNACCRANGSSIAMTTPNSIGWVAVLDGRLKPFRSSSELTSTAGLSPGMWT